MRCPCEWQSRQGRRPCPINEAERNVLFCKSRMGRAKQVLGKHYPFCLYKAGSASGALRNLQNLKRKDDAD